MRRTLLLIEKEVLNARIGTMNVPEFKLTSKLNRLVPYCKHRENLDSLLRYSKEILDKDVPVELCGFSTYSLIQKANSLEAELKELGLPTYLIFSSEHPLIMTFPPDVIWLAKKSGLRAWKNSIDYITSLGENYQPKKIIKKIISSTEKLITDHPKTYQFWTRSTRTHIEKIKLSQWLINLSIDFAVRTRCKMMGGIVPVIDSKVKKSVDYNKTYNLAYAHIIRDRYNQDSKTPTYFYTINMNSSLFARSEWHPFFNKILRDVKQAILVDEEDLRFDGVLLSLRGLDRISLSESRVDTVKLFIERLKTICYDADLPLILSRFGLVGLSLFDIGINYCSYDMNMGIDDAFRSGGDSSIKDYYKFGKTINIDQKKFWFKNEIEKTISNPKLTLPSTINHRNMPTNEELNSPSKYRIHFSRPYNVASMTLLNNQWFSDIENKESKPGTEYLKDFEAPYSSWGKR
jgi:hypothetical protein